VLAEVFRSRLTVACGVALAALGALDAARVAWRQRAIDFDYVQDYVSARFGRQGESIYLPDPAAPGDRVPDRPVGKRNDHPPTYVALLAPLGALRYDQAYLTLSLISLAAGGWAAWTVGRELGWPAGGTWLLVAAVAHHPGVGACMMTGNLSLILAALVVAGWAAARRARDWTAGAALGLAAAVKLFPAFLLVAPLLGRRWTVVGVAAMVAAAVVGGAVGLYGVGDLLYFATVRAPENAAEGVGNGLNLSLPGVSHRLFGGPNRLSDWQARAVTSPRLAAALALACQLGVGVLTAVRIWRLPPDQRAGDAGFAVAVPGMFLASPVSWLHFVPVMALPVAVLARDAIRGRRWGRLAVLAAAVGMMTVSDRDLADLLLARSESGVLPWPTTLLLLTPTWGVLATFAVALLPTPRSRPDGPGGE
jgi:alpha-1,2-mannosyltransferase